MAALPAGGAMVADPGDRGRGDGPPAADADAGAVSIAAVNGPSSVVISGDETAVTRDRGEASARRAERLGVCR